MNRKQKVLTVIALIGFVLVPVGNYYAWPPIRHNPYNNAWWIQPSSVAVGGRWESWPPILTNAPIISNMPLAWFMLGVIYVGLFFLLADKKEKRP